jgi:DNA-binding MarR family transcriptional regulator
MPRTPGELAENVDVDAVTDAVLAAARLLMAVTARSIAAVDESTTLAQFRLLVILNSVGAVKHAALADQLGVSRMVDRLVAGGMVARQTNPASRREIVIELTAEGQRIVRQVTARRRKEIAKIVARMPERNRAGLVDVLLAFAEAGGEPAVIDTGWA